MAQAIKLHVTEKGEDPRDYVLNAFGGAGPLHAYDIAKYLGIKTRPPLSRPAVALPSPPKSLFASPWPGVE